MENCVIRFAKTDDYNKVETIMQQVQQLHIDWRPDLINALSQISSGGNFYVSFICKGIIIIAAIVISYKTKKERAIPMRM